MKHLLHICFATILGASLLSTSAHADPAHSLNDLLASFEYSFTNDFNNGTGGTILTLGIPTDNIVPPSPTAPDGLNIRLINVYLPEGYETSTERYPVVLYLPGLGGTAASFVIGNKFILDKLIKEKQIVPMIVVNNDPSLIDGPTPQGTYTYSGSWYVNSALNGAFEDFIINNTIDFIDSNFRTKASAGYRGVMGQSMGAFGSVLLGMKHPEKFIGFGACSPTAIWALATTNLAREPDGALFTINSLIQPEIPSSGPNAGKIAPSNGGGITPDGASATYSYFSYSAAFSPDLNALAGDPANPFQATYFVDLPFKVQGDGTPVYGPGPYMGANPTTGAPVEFAQTLILTQTVIDRWFKNDPYHLIDTRVDDLKHQNFYFDAGDQPDDNVDNRGARLLSEKLANLQIDHEYVLFDGGHITCLVDANCSRHQTIFQMLSATFSENGQDPNILRTKIAGTGTIIIEQNAIMEINNGTMVGFETLPDNGITITNITLQLNDNGKVLIGTDIERGGALQVGNLFSKAKIFGKPSLTTNKVSTHLIIDGHDAQFQIGKQGFFGLGVGLIGQFPEVPNDWGMSTLQNADQITIDIRRGVFEHNQIASGLETIASVFALGPCTQYTFHLNHETATMQGGANLATIPDGWRLQPVNITDPGVLFPDGVRNILDTTEPIVLDVFYKRNIASTGFYTNDSFREMLSSADQLDNRGNDIPYEFVGTLSQFTEYLEQIVYPLQAAKEGAIATVNNTLRIGYLDLINTQPKFIRTENIPFNVGQVLDIQKLLASGTAGIWVTTQNNQRDLIRIYDIDPCSQPTG